MLEVKPAIPESGLTIAEAARRSGVSAHTLRYYERAGLVVTPVGRTQGGRRRYHHIDLQWIKVCTKLRATGMSIAEIRRYAELVTAGAGNEQTRLELLEAHRDRVLTEIAELQENLETITHKIDVYRGRLAAGDADRLWAPRPEAG
jgi:DNA-binding transcriptional MerR regulator